MVKMENFMMHMYPAVILKMPVNLSANCRNLKTLFHEFHKMSELSQQLSFYAIKYKATLKGMKSRFYLV